MPRTDQKVIDAFLYSGEKNLLEIRISQLDSLVDVFVILESRYTFAGELRHVDLYFREKILSKYGKRVRWEVLEEFVPGTAWEREAAQRQAIANQLIDLAPGDYVMISDIDEIPSASFVKTLEKLDRGEYLIARMLLFRYCPHFLSKETWYGTIGFCFDGHQIDYQAMRMKSVRYWLEDEKRIIVDGGNHYTTFLGPKTFKEKIKSFSHTELNVFPFNNSIFLSLLIYLGISLDGSEVLRFVSTLDRLVISEVCSKNHKFDRIRVFMAYKVLAVFARVFDARVYALSSPD
jgi:hypothetical protein